MSQCAQELSALLCRPPRRFDDRGPPRRFDGPPRDGGGYRDSGGGGFGGGGGGGFGRPRDMGFGRGGDGDKVRSRGCMPCGMRSCFGLLMFDGCLQSGSIGGMPSLRLLWLLHGY